MILWIFDAFPVGDNAIKLIASFGKTRVTGLSEILDGEISHDKTTRFLGVEDYSRKDLWKLIKKKRNKYGYIGSKKLLLDMDCC